MKYIFILSITLLNLVSLGQIQDSTVQFAGKGYCLHKMEQGETLYQLSKKYKVAFSLIKEANPEKGDSIALGELVRIPCNYILSSNSEESSKNLEEKTVDLEGNIGRQSSIVAIAGHEEEIEKRFEKAQDKNLQSTKEMLAEQDRGSSAEDSLLMGYFWYEVKQGETVYTLLKKHHTNEEQFYQDNPEVKTAGLKTGSKVLFYKRSKSSKHISNEETVVTSKPKDESHGKEYPKNKKIKDDKSLLYNLLRSLGSAADSMSMRDSNVFRIGFLLPFNLEQNKEAMDAMDEGQEISVMKQTRFFLEFLQGATFAIDSLKNKGLNVQVFVYDSKSDTNHIASLFNKAEFSMLDMIFGPAYGHNFEFLAKKMKGKSTYLVSPYGKKMSIIAHNPRVVKCRSSLESRISPLASFLYSKHKNDSIILNHEGANDLMLVQILQAEIMALSLLYDSVIMPIPIITKGVFEPLEKLSEQSKNVVVSLNTKESFATKLVVKLQAKHKDYDVMLVGMEEWKSYKNIEVRYWEALHMHVVGNLDFRYTSIKNEGFFESYFKVYYSEPSYHAVLAYELLVNLLGNVKNNEFNHTQVAGKLMEGDISTYQFKFAGSQTGVDNKSATVYSYKDFKFVPIHE